MQSQIFFKEKKRHHDTLTVSNKHIQVEMRKKVRTSYTDLLKRIAAVNRDVFVGSIPS